MTTKTGLTDQGLRHAFVSPNVPDSNGEPTIEPPPGIRCPACGECELTLTTNASGQAVLTCASCKVFLRLLQRHGDPLPAIDADDTTADAPPVGSWWLAYIVGGDDICRPIALAETLGGAWEGALHCPLRGTIYMAPTDPPRRLDYQRVVIEDGL
jgi:hypothetical protein